MATRPLPIKGSLLSSKMACSAEPHATQPIQYKNWSSKDPVLACKAVSSGLSITKGAEDYQIYKPIIQDYVSGKVEGVLTVDNEST